MNLPPKKLMLIGISGKKRHGKTTLANELQQVYKDNNVEAVCMGFADELKLEVALALRIGVDTIEKNKDKFRPLLQWWGQVWRREITGGPDYWIERFDESTWLSRICTSGSKPIIIIPDVRYENEAEFIRQNGGLILRVERADFVDTEGHTEHSSETALDDYKHFHWTVVNRSPDSLKEYAQQHAMQLYRELNPTTTTNQNV